MKVFGYIRVSTDEQEKSGLGLESQKKKIKAYCKLYGLDLVHIFMDAKSGKNLNRPGLKTALKTLPENGGLIVSKLDRLTRSVKDMGFLLENYFDKVFALHVVDEKLDTTSASGRMIINMLMSIAQWERETISERIKAALKVKKDRGEKTGGYTPFGYDCIDGKLIVNEKDQSISTYIYKLRCTGMSYQKIADHLNEHGYKTKTGKKWAWNTVRKIFLNYSNQ